MMNRLLCALLLLALPIIGHSQNNVDYRTLYYGEAVIPTWYEDGTFSYRTRTSDGVKYFLVDPTTKQKKEVAADYKPTEAKKADNAKKSDAIFVEDFNVYAKDGDGKVQLTFDGSFNDSYRPNVNYSPDGNYAIVSKVSSPKQRTVTFVESSPEGQLQPKLHTNIYVKPGEDIPVEFPRVFDVKNKKMVDVDFSPYMNQYHIRYIRWNEDSKSYTFEYNVRGHQSYQVVEVDVTTGNTRVVIEESFPTFVHYSKLFRHHLDSKDEILWVSERDGWRHLYAFDATQNNVVKRQLTKGNWVVKEVLYVDEDNEKIYFTGTGRNTKDNPYFVHLYSVGFDGKNLKDLTPEAGTHVVSISKDKKYFVDACSTVEDEPVSTLRDLNSGKVVMNLEKGDATKALAAGWRKPVPFKAKGRDGKTDIYGNIYFPKNYDPNKKYPVVEHIYAGPHGCFVLHDFHVDTYYRGGLTEHDYFVVQIDGMGTTGRSKEFHDICWQNLKDAGFPDRILWIKAAAKKYPAIDVERVGIYGVSSGGQSAVAALLFFNDFYKAATASCGCHDNRMDKIWWNEQWMGYPIGKQYSESSNVDNAHLLKGRLMLSVGENDTNVDPASTMQVVDALIKAGKYFELIILPSKAHTLGGNYGMDRMIDFFNRNLKDPSPVMSTFRTN